MSGFLIFISFLLNIVALLAIVLLYTRQNRLMEIEKNQKNTIKEMEDIISSYLLEMKEENEQFIKQLEDRSKRKNNVQPTSNKQDSGNTLQVPKYTETATYQVNRVNASKAYSITLHDNAIDHENKDLLPPIPIEEESSEDTIENKIFRMHQNGKSTEEIAKLLGKGKTEIELLLKFRQNT